jgi:hypothetical protein
MSGGTGGFISSHLQLAYATAMTISCEFMNRSVYEEEVASNQFPFAIICLHRDKFCGSSTDSFEAEAQIKKSNFKFQISIWICFPI